MLQRCCPESLNCLWQLCLISDSSDTCCLSTCLWLMQWVSQLSIPKQPVSRPSGVLKPIMAAILLLNKKRWAHWGRKSQVAPLLCRDNPPPTHTHTQWCSGTIRVALHSLCPSVWEWGGAWRGSYLRRRERSYVREFSLMAQSNSCWRSVNSSSSVLVYL